MINCNNTREEACYYVYYYITYMCIQYTHNYFAIVILRKNLNPLYPPQKKIL